MIFVFSIIIVFLLTGYIIYYLKANYLKCSLLSSTSQK
ncbi:hypothetical protein BACOVA_03418 [Bacteroides ovatus ATCC 8483]|uniref:Uncharacterized protein n=1 Tax=Bacteroides ovatus (strain ATCC 8483 / DSM 1896 / JCM 5824 / BCRC 10623 / CCUG 4943 / NCTC 11153) TaxID=411476 RepID=A0AAN3A7Q9_BACO1|nr:hypothetical protein BACOVA_03418 [Bacteroides ovatus ATCC 8483]